jgi:hypothetical protein
MILGFEARQGRPGQDGGAPAALDGAEIPSDRHRLRDKCRPLLQEGLSKRTKFIPLAFDPKRTLQKEWDH